MKEIQVMKVNEIIRELEQRTALTDENRRYINAALTGTVGADGEVNPFRYNGRLELFQALETAIPRSGDLGTWLAYVSRVADAIEAKTGGWLSDNKNLAAERMRIRTCDTPAPGAPSVAPPAQAINVTVQVPPEAIRIEADVKLPAPGARKVIVRETHDGTEMTVRPA